MSTNLREKFVLDRPTQRGKYGLVALLVVLYATVCITIWRKDPQWVTAILGGLTGLMMLIILFIDGLPKVSVAIFITVTGIATYFLLDIAVLGGASHWFTELLQEMTLVLGIIFPGAMLGALWGHRIFANPLLQKPHDEIRNWCAVVIFAGISLLAWKASLAHDLVSSANYLAPFFFSCGEFLIALGIGLFVESRSKSAENLNK